MDLGRYQIIMQQCFHVSSTGSYIHMRSRLPITRPRTSWKWTEWNDTEEAND